MQEDAQIKDELSKIPTIGCATVTLGCDPEFFVETKSGKAKPSPMVAVDGVPMSSSYTEVQNDGLVLELRVKNGGITCRETLSSFIKSAMMDVKRFLDEKSYKSTVSTCTRTFSKRDFDKVDNSHKVFGCNSSNSVYTGSESLIGVNPLESRQRSCGGHMHFGMVPDHAPIKAGALLGKDEINAAKLRAVRLLDIFVGVPSVILDRAPGSKERRKSYGRAGEYRDKPYGIEYRTPSNFWLGSYQLFSLVFGLGRAAVRISYNKQLSEFIFSRFNENEVQDCINNNDLKLAWKLYDELEKIMISIENSKHSSWISLPIDLPNLQYLRVFLSGGIKKWFKQDMLEHWATLKGVNNPRIGMNDYLESVVKYSV